MSVKNLLNSKIVVLAMSQYLSEKTYLKIELCDCATFNIIQNTYAYLFPLH